MFDDELKNRVAYMQTHDLFLEGWDTLALYNMALSSSVASVQKTILTLLTGQKSFTKAFCF